MKSKAVAKVSVSILVPLNTHRELGRVLSTFESMHSLAPLYHGWNERKRLSYDRADAQKTRPFATLMLWRSKSLNYEAMLSCDPLSVNRIELWSKRPYTHDELTTMYRDITGLVCELGVEYGLIRQEFVGVAKQDRDLPPGTDVKAREFYENGPKGIGLRTWFGPMLAERIGRERFAQLANVTRLANGGLQLDLVPNPWMADYPTLLAAQRQIFPILSESGMFTPKPSHERAPAWTKPDWTMKVET